MRDFLATYTLRSLASIGTRYGSNTRGRAGAGSSWPLCHNNILCIDLVSVLLSQPTVCRKYKPCFPCPMDGEHGDEENMRPVKLSPRTPTNYIPAQSADPVSIATMKALEFSLEISILGM
jgi:hypothetical protein